MLKKIIELCKIRKRRREIEEIQKHLKYILHVNDDILAKSTKDKLSEIIAESDNVDPLDAEAASRFIERAPLRAAKILPKRRFSVLREYADIAAVAFTVAFGVRALFLQPFKIPTSSMQPTLFGIHYIADRNTLPNLPGLLHYLLFSTQRAELTVKREGFFDPGSVVSYKRFVIFPRTRFNIAGITYDLPGEFNPGQSGDNIDKYCLHGRQEFKEGEVLCKGWLSLGDHLFVDRFTYHFREARRGDIVVFNTEGLPCCSSGYFYIKRLIGIPGDTIKILNSKVYIKAKGEEEFIPITDLDIKGIDRIYSWRGGYHGHLPVGAFSKSFGPKKIRESLAFKIKESLVERKGGVVCKLSSSDLEIKVPEDHYFMLGDNSANSWDSRYWGFVPRRNIVGRAFFIFWPFSRRWGLADTKDPLPVDTEFPELPSMSLQ